MWNHSSLSRLFGKRLMPPPAPRVVSKKPKVLDEDTYIAAMGEIIERDFYPDLPKLQRQLKWLEAVDRKDMATLTHVSAIIAIGVQVGGNKNNIQSYRRMVAVLLLGVYCTRKYLFKSGDVPCDQNQKVAW